MLLDQGNSVLSQVWLTVDSCSRIEKAERKLYCLGLFLVTPHMFVLSLDGKIY